MDYTLKYYAIGKPVNGDNFKVYLRYYIKGLMLNIPTEYILSKEQVKLANTNGIQGKIQKDLEIFKSNVRKVIETMNLMNNYYPSPAQLKEHYNKVEHTQPIGHYIIDYVEQLQKSGKSSKELYKQHQKKFNTYYNYNLKNTPPKNLVNLNTVTIFGKWMNQRQEAIGKKKYGDMHIYNVKSTVLRFLNYIAKQQKLPKISDRFANTTY